MIIEFIERNCGEVDTNEVNKLMAKAVDESITLETIREMYRIRGLGGLSNKQIEAIMTYWSDCDECMMRADLLNDCLVVTYNLGLGDIRGHIYALRYR